MTTRRRGRSTGDDHRGRRPPRRTPRRAACRRWSATPSADDRELLLSFAPRRLRLAPRPGRARPVHRGPDRAACRTTSGSSSGSSRPPTQVYRGCPASTSSCATRSRPTSSGSCTAEPPPGDHDRRDPHPRRALHLREPQELLPPRRPARLLGHPPHAVRAPAVGAHRGPRPSAGRGLAGVVLPLPDRARGLQGAPRPHRARDLLGAEGGLHRGRGLRRHAAGGARAGPAAARPQGRRGARGAPRAASSTGCSPTTTSSWAR